MDLDTPEQASAKRDLVKRALRNAGFRGDEELAQEAGLSVAQARAIVDDLVHDGTLDPNTIASARRTGIRAYDLAPANRSQP